MNRFSRLFVTFAAILFLSPLVVLAQTDITPPTVGDVLVPSIGPIYGGDYTRFGLYAFDDVGIDECFIYLDGQQIPMIKSTDPSEPSLYRSSDYLWPISSQEISHTLYARCFDLAGNARRSSGDVNVIIFPTNTEDVSIINSSVTHSPSSAIANGTDSIVVNVRVMDQNDRPINNKYVWLVTSRVGSVLVTDPSYTDANGNASFLVTSVVEGPVSLTAMVDNRPIAQQPVVQFTAPSCPHPTSMLVKLPDDGDAQTSYDSAVYYYGRDCKRHAFPNDKIYFTWFTNFDNVTIVSQETMASMPLGKNVTYKPGIQLVKFQTLPNVFAIGKNRMLRWITNEQVATQLYGPNWNLMVHDLSEVFHGDYGHGQDITSVSDFQPQNETANAPTIDFTL